MGNELPKTEPERVWQRFRLKMGDPSKTTRDGRRRAEQASAASKPFGKGRDPKGLADVLKGVTDTYGWTQELARGDLIGSWPELVGEKAAPFSTAIEVIEDELVVQCTSTAWAQQLRMMHGDILTKLLDRFPETKVRRIRFRGPYSGTFKRGYRSVPGRGPRDTFG